MINLTRTDTDGKVYFPDAYLGEAKYYAVDFSTWLTTEGDTLSSVVWTVPAGVTGSDDNVEGNVASIKLTPSAVGTHEIICTLNSTDAGKTQVKIVKIYLKAS